MTVTTALIDYGAGNLQSVRNALMAAGADKVAVTADPDILARADRIVLPGVGAFAACMSALSAIPGMVEAMTSRVHHGGVPFLGICVGMQLLADAGVEHGTHPGLGWIGGTVSRIEASDPAIKVPHMGWNDVTPVRPHALIEAGEAYYLHSYHFDMVDEENIIARTRHGTSLVAAVARDNVVGVQFHPEKSQAFGINFLKCYLEWKP